MCWDSKNAMGENKTMRVWEKMVERYKTFLKKCVVINNTTSLLFLCQYLEMAGLKYPAEMNYTKKRYHRKTLGNEMYT